MKTIIQHAANPFNLHHHADSAYAIPVSQLVDLSGNEDFYLFEGMKRNRAFDQVVTRRLSHAEGSTPAENDLPFIWDGSTWIDPTDGEQTKSVSKKKHWIVLVVATLVIAAAIKTLLS